MAAATQLKKDLADKGVEHHSLSVAVLNAKQAGVISDTAAQKARNVARKANVDRHQHFHLQPPAAQHFYMGDVEAEMEYGRLEQQVFGLVRAVRQLEDLVLGEVASAESLVGELGWRLSVVEDGLRSRAGKAQREWNVPAAAAEVKSQVCAVLAPLASSIPGPAPAALPSQRNAPGLRQQQDRGLRS